MVTAIKIKLQRDQVRAMQQHFHPYLVELCEMRIRDCGGEQDGLINLKAIQSLFHQVTRIVDKKLVTKADTFTLELCYAEAVAYRVMIMQLPLNPQQIWLVNLRQHVCDLLLNQLIEP